MWTQETGKQIVSAWVGDVIIRTIDWRKTSQVRLPSSASRHYTHRKKKTVGLCGKERTVTINFGSGRKLKSQDLRKGRGRIGGDGHTVEPYVRHNTDKNPYLFTATATGSS